MYRQLVTMPAVTRPALAVLLAIALMTVAAPPAEARPGGSCSVPGAKTLVRAGQVRVYLKGRIRYACHRRANRLTRLNQIRFGDTSSYPVNSIRIAGPFVGYGLAYSGRTYDYARVRVIDARTGRVVHSTFQGRRRGGTGADVRDLELARTGAVAWITLEETGCGNRSCLTQQCIVRSSDGGSRRSARELDLGECFEAGIEPESLSLRGSTLTWSKLGRAVTAVLRG